MTRRLVHFILLVTATTLWGCNGEDPATATERTNVQSNAEPVIIEAVADPTEVDIGEHVVYTVKVNYDPELEIEWPAVLTQFENWVLLDAGDWTPPEKVGTRERRHMDITLDPGIGPVLTVPPTVLRYRRPTSDVWLEVRTAEITIEVLDPTGGDPGEFREPIEPILLPEKTAETERVSPAALVAVVGGIVLLFVALWFFLLRKKRGLAVRVPPPHEIAIQELDRLDAMELLERGDVKGFHYRLTDVLRRYIESRFEIAAQRQTTEEFLVAMKTSPVLDEKKKSLLREFLEAADLVRYARHLPSREESGRSMSTARNFVNVTARDDEPATETEVAHAV